MKASKYIFLFPIFSLVLFVSSCSESIPYVEEEYINSFLSVNPSTITMEGDQEQGDFYVSSNGSWSINAKSSWISPVKSYGSYYDKVTFNVDINDGESNRNGYIEVKLNEGFQKKARVEIIQKPMQFSISMGQTSYKADGDFWFMSIIAPSNKSWTASSNESWVSFSSSKSRTYSGKGNQSLSVYASENTSTYSRSATISVTCGSMTKTITISQAGSSSSAFSVTMSTTNYAAEGDYWFLGVSAPSSKSWTASANQTWVHFRKYGSSSQVSTYYGSGNEDIWVHVDANPSSAKRYATITVKCSGYTDKIVYISQDAK